MKPMARMSHDELLASIIFSDLPQLPQLSPRQVQNELSRRRTAHRRREYLKAA